MFSDGQELFGNGDEIAPGCTRDCSRIYRQEIVPGSEGTKGCSQMD